MNSQLGAAAVLAIASSSIQACNRIINAYCLHEWSPYGMPHRYLQRLHSRFCSADLQFKYERSAILHKFALSRVEDHVEYQIIHSAPVGQGNELYERLMQRNSAIIWLMI